MRKLEFKYTKVNSIVLQVRNISYTYMGIVKMMRQFANDTKRNALIFAQPNALNYAETHTSDYSPMLT